jgi:hypothetical protein
MKALICHFRENLSVSTNYWYIKAVLVNFFLFLVLFFLTTPAIVVNFLDTMTVEYELEKMVSKVNVLAFMRPNSALN